MHQRHDIAKYISRGKSPRYTEHSILPVINQKAIRWFGIEDRYLKYVHPDQIKEWTEERFIQDGDILWNSTGRGTMGRACLIHPEHLIPPKVVDSHVTIVRPFKDAIDSRYLFAWIRSPHIQDTLESLATGATNQIELSRAVIAEIELPLAPLSEQKRIVEKLDLLFTRIDSCRSHLERVPQILRRFRKSVLAVATSGRLTKDWRKEKGIKYDWKKVGLSDIGTIGRGKSKHRPRNDKRLYGGDYPFIQTGDIAQSNGWITSHTQTYSKFGLEQSKLWPANTVCITIAANIANTAILSYPACFPDSIVGFIADPEKSLPQFVKWSIDVIKDDLESIAPATAQKNINLGILEEVQFDCPPLKEQAEIVRLVEKLFAYADQLEARYQSAMKQVGLLHSSLLAKAFRGELVAQDPNDEPAEKLLQSIIEMRKSEATKRKAEPRKKKEKKMSIIKNRQPLYETLMASKGARLTPDQLFNLSGYEAAFRKENSNQEIFDVFYEELRSEIQRGHIKEARPNKNTVYLIGVKS